MSICYYIFVYVNHTMENRVCMFSAICCRFLPMLSVIFCQFCQCFCYMTSVLPMFLLYDVGFANFFCHMMWILAILIQEKYELDVSHTWSLANDCSLSASFSLYSRFDFTKCLRVWYGQFPNLSHFRSSISRSPYHLTNTKQIPFSSP